MSQKKAQPERLEKRVLPVATPIAGDSETLFTGIRELLHRARQTVVRQIDTIQVVTNFEIGRMIVEHEQQGKQRADYGKALLKELSRRLAAEFGRGFSWQNLYSMRNFYLTYRNDFERIFQTASGKSEGRSLSWSHYLVLMGVKQAEERRFYEIEASGAGWSVRELERQIGSALYERLALSRNKTRIRQLASQGQLITSPSDAIKDPYVLEFLGLEDRAAYSETDLETAIINKLEHFLLELGKGFLFEARQKRLSFEEDHFYVDLVFYNRLLRCYVLIDLKLDKLTHQDLGQMQMYVNYFDRYVKTEHENPTVGIVLCKRKKDALIELTLPQDANIYASQYQLYLPSKEDLRRQLETATREVREQRGNTL